MATPSSSATSPSPPMAYLTHLALAQQAPQLAIEKDEKKKAVQKFLARAELSSVTRSLRARLSQASNKAGSTSPYPSYRELDAQSPSSFSRTNPAKRKAPGASHYYGTPATSAAGGSGASASPLRRGSLGTMAPPLNTAPKSSINGSGTASGSGTGDQNNSSRNAPSQSLYTSILAPPPAKQARTILNASDPPRAAPVRPVSSPRSGNAKVIRSIAEGTRSAAKSRTVPKKSSDSRKSKGSAEKRRRSDHNVDADGDVDMKAAATLTSLLLHRSSIASTSSPRSSVDGNSEAGSTQPYSHFAQSSTRNLAQQPSISVSSVASTSTIEADPGFRGTTPPGGQPAPTDNEAADLMLFLATSPSPARSSNRDAKDLAAYRALGGGTSALRAKGRVLFPSHSEQDDGSASPSLGGSVLARAGEGSFSSSISTIGTEVASVGSQGDNKAQLLPPPPLPSSPSTYRKIQDASPRPSSGQDFNFNDYLNASPSPVRQKVNLGLRADVGRKLFEEEQMRLGMPLGAPSGAKNPEQRSLGAGIDLLKS
ncbi:hypothetical protein C8J56DRAFT_1045362 [Mycena floridula]|nr:hypothetical protein C8J56DRAFT_1045362 [Mycena floridula]